MKLGPHQRRDRMRLRMLLFRVDQVLRRHSYRALAEGFISLSKAAELLRLPVPEVEAGLKGPQKSDEDNCQ